MQRDAWHAGSNMVDLLSLVSRFPCCPPATSVHLPPTAGSLQRCEGTARLRHNPCCLLLLPLQAVQLLQCRCCCGGRLVNQATSLARLLEEF